MERHDNILKHGDVTDGSRGGVYSREWHSSDK